MSIYKASYILIYQILSYPSTTTIGVIMNQQLVSLSINYECLTKKPDFEVVVAQSIDQTLSALGEPVKMALYSCLESSYGIKKIDIGAKTATFTIAIESLFGAAARLLEIKIMKTLNRQIQGFSYRPINGEFSFTDYLTALQKHLASN
jgi:hypothetical protein